MPCPGARYPAPRTPFVFARQADLNVQADLKVRLYGIGRLKVRLYVP
jgi:hypothetical protein